MNSLTRRQQRRLKKARETRLGQIKQRVRELARDKDLMAKIDAEMKGKSLEEYIAEARNNALLDS